MITDRMTPSFRTIEGGLFNAVEKADVGDGVMQLQAQGATLMCWADPFFPDPVVPPHVSKATAEAILGGSSGHYTAPIGNTQLKIEIANYLKASTGQEVNALRNILITPGSDSGLFYAMLPFIEKDDEVMIVDPSYPNNFQNTSILGGKIVRVPVRAETGWQLEISEFEKRLSSKTKMVVLTNPNNPTTTVYRRSCLEDLAQFIQKNDLVLVVDQAFEFPTFDNIPMVEISTLPGMWERTLTVHSFSKGMGLSGYRVGYIVADDVIMDKLFGAVVSVLGATNSAAQIGVIAALKDPSFLQEFARTHLWRRDYVYEKLHDIPGLRLMKSESGFLSWVNVSALGNSNDIVAYLIKEANLVVNSGENYGEGGKGYIRIVHGVLGGEEQFKDAILRLRHSLLKLSESKGLVNSAVTTGNQEFHKA